MILKWLRIKLMNLLGDRYSRVASLLYFVFLVVDFTDSLDNELQALAASGLRALRYAREVEGLGAVIALDNDRGIILSFLLPKLICTYSYICLFS